MSAGRAAPEPIPDFIQPCLASLAKQPPDGALWVHEIKFDGYRLQARIEQGEVRLMTRSGLDWTQRFGQLANKLAALRVSSAIIDGEVVVQDDKGLSNFVDLVDDLKAGRSDRMLYYMFDLLHLNGASTLKLPLADRKELLAQILKGQRKTGQLRFSQHFVGNGAGQLAAACELGMEGIISKRLDKPYHSGRGADWLKAKCLQSDEFVIGGYLDSTALKNSIGALALGVYRGDAFVYMGRVGTGFNRRAAAELWKRLQPLRADKSPFAAALDPLQRRGVKWVKPELVAQIDYRTRTGDDLLRHASFKALREDKPAREVTGPSPKA